jgi:AcrR family transcriptional regulator
MSPRMSAEDRREQVIREAIAVFARFGYEGATTAAIAERVGVTQPYLFKLFPSKKELFLVASERNMVDTLNLMRAAAGGLTGRAALEAMGEAYSEKLKSDRGWLQMQLQSYAACEDEDVQSQTRECLRNIWTEVQSLAAGVSIEEMVTFFATGMFCNVLAAVGRAGSDDPEWAPMIDAISRINGKTPAAGKSQS